LAKLILNGATSGSISLESPAVSGTTTLTLPATSGTIVTTTSGAITSAQLPAGSVLQVVSTTKTDAYSNAAQNAWNDVTGLSVSITPSSASNKILVTGQLSYSAASNLYFRLVRVSTAIAVGDTAGSRISCTGASGYNFLEGNVGANATFEYLDSPSATTSTTYKIQVYGYNATQYVNRVVTDTDSGISPRNISTITVTEVKA
jgi:hypothetical protein